MRAGKNKKIKRTLFSRGYADVMEVPNLVDIQIASYERFLQRKTLQKGEPPARQGLEEVFQSTFPIESPNGDMLLEYCGFSSTSRTSSSASRSASRRG